MLHTPHAPSHYLKPQIWLPAAIAIVATQAVILFAMGQPAICACGFVKLWHGSASSPETSQHIFDWYTLSHILHGVIFYALLKLVAPRASLGALFLAALAIEAAWEITENTPIIVDRYRQLALAQGYTGDSVLNSVFDTLAAGAGFMLARFAPVWLTAMVAIAFEAVAAYSIRDNLTLNIIQLVYPIEAISRWQAAG
ncbi:MAG: DUF2585 family protein [Beijerinckiaceae bacterium]|nr:DUF2585 family protein [Beijerinckiaceae bacterium]